MGMYGADVAGLRSLAASFEQGADDLASTRAVLRDAIEGSRWQGADAAEMRGAWSSLGDRALAQACRVLADCATALRREADEQDAASAGPAPSAGTTPPGPVGAARPVDHLLPEEGDALDAVGGSSSTLKNEQGSVTHGVDGFEGQVELPGTLHVGADGDGYEAGLAPEQTIEGSLEGVGKASITSRVEVVVSTTSADGFDEYTLSADASATVAGEASLWRVSAEGEAARGERFTFGVRVPEGTALDPSTVDPFSPGTYPPGTRITLEGEAYRSHSTTFGYDLVRSAHSAEEATGVTTTIEWLAGDTVRIATGDTESMALGDGVRLGRGDWSAMLGRTNELSSAEMGEVTLDLSRDAGRAAYDRFLGTGELPAASGDGISGTTTFSTYDFSSGGTVDLTTPLLELVHENVTSTGSGVTVLHPDGTSDHHGQVALQGGVERTYSHHLDAHGDVVPARSTDSYVFRATGTTGSWIDNPNLSIGDGTSVAAGSTVRITFTPAQMADLQQLAESHVDPWSGGPLVDVVYDVQPFAEHGPTATPRTPSGFADALFAQTGRAGDGAGGDLMLERVSTIMSRAGAQEFPGTVEIVEE